MLPVLLNKHIHLTFKLPFLLLFFYFLLFSIRVNLSILAPFPKIIVSLKESIADVR